ncbi:hypothetical protein [Vibrio sp. V08_P9A1T1]|uniref:hypothetical protein n=1 Tax=Vibrio sp. V08_P9A1T1 TaxID=1938663 RepID=UPI000B8E6592|nr:hypothetical protein [Vibrio sp. V08_P9A1T1]OXX29092.1 hypothetical protein B9J92_02365 [Vibrio sp. V08_P9A1T1]
MKTIVNLTSDDILLYLSKMHKGSCPFCTSKAIPMTFIENKDNQKIIFSELKAFDAYGQANPWLNSTPVIPLLCPDCGYISQLVIHPVLKFLNKDDV